MQTALATDPAGPAGAARRGIALPLLAAVLVMLTFLTLQRAPTDLTVDTDTSLSEVLNYANQHGLQFGTELVSTYGPLGYLIFFYFSPHAAGLRLGVDVALCLTVAVGLCLVAWRLRPVWGVALVGVFAFVAPNLEPRTDLVIYTGLLCWGLLCFVESGRRLTVSVLSFAVLAAFCALAKTSMLFVTLPGVVLLAGDLMLRGQFRQGLAMVTGFGAVFAVGWLAAGQDLLHLGTYLANALAIVQGYNQALAWEALAMARWSGLCVILLATGVVMMRALAAFEAQEGRRGWRRLLVLAWAGQLLFTVWKHGFVRGDSYHLVYFFGFVPALVLALEVLPCERRAARVWARALGAVCCLLALLTLQSLFFPSGWRSLAQPVWAFGSHARCLLKPGDCLRRMNEIVEDNRGRARSPALGHVVGRASVDVVGQQPVYALLNDLNYCPRPVFQSYLACNQHLMRLNEEFYLSAAAPEYVMFALGPIDRRFPPLEDAMLLRFLLFNYQPVGAEGDFLLLQRESSRPPQLQLLREGTVRPGERIDLRDFGQADLWLEVQMEPTRFGQLRQILYQPTAVRLAAWGEEGPKKLLARRRAPVPMLAAGFVASPLLLRNEDVARYYRREPLSRPTAYSVELLPGDESCWQSAAYFRIFETLPAQQPAR